MSDIEKVNSIPNLPAVEGIDKFVKDCVANTMAPYLSLVTTQSKDFKDQKITQFDVYALTVNDQIINLGKEVPVLVLASRPKAIRSKGGETEVYYEPNSDGFKKIQAISEERNSGAFWGMEFLLWHAEHGYMQWMCGSKSARNQINNMLGRMNKGVLLKTKHCKTPEYDWTAPLVVPTDILESPDIEEATERATKFVSQRNPVIDAAPDQGIAR